MDNRHTAKSADKTCACKKRRLIKWAVTALCLSIAVFVVFLLSRHHSSPHVVSPGIGPAHVAIDGRKFYISAHLSVSDELPEGFTAAGNIDISGGHENCPYFLNPDIPEWIYVYHEVRTNGEVDEWGTLINTEPHDAYVRYVDERLRNADLICSDGKYYISMWSANYYGDEPDVTEEYYRETESLYGIRIEGNVPEDFVSAGIAEFSGNDTVPNGKLAGNTGADAVYYNPNDPSVILAETHWYTSTAEEKGETRHDGFNVYILYDCPFA